MGLTEILLAALAPLRPRVAARLGALEAAPDAWADAFLGAVERIKGAFAQALVVHLENTGARLAAPEYLASAVAWAAGRSSADDDLI